MLRTVERLGSNLRLAVRAWMGAPSLAATVVLTLALGIGAASAVFTIIDSVLLEPLPFPAADRLVTVDQTREGAPVANVAPVRLEEWNERNSTFVALTGYYTEDFSDTAAEVPERVRVASVAPRFLDVFGIAPLLGRGFVPDDYAPGAAPVVVIGERFWRRRFDADPDVIGRVIGSEEGTAEIVGVLPASFAFPDPTVQAWSANVYYDFVLSRGNAWYTAYGRLRDGVTLEQGLADLVRIQRQLGEQYPDTDRDIGVAIASLHEATVGNVRASLWVLFGAVAVLLAIACTNIAALLLARAADRQRDVAVRVAFGGSRTAIGVQILTEAAVLAAAGGALGLWLAYVIADVVRALAPDFPRIDEIAPDAATVLVVGALVVVVTVLCGLAPVVLSARGVAAQRLVESGRGQVAGRQSLQWGFVGAQVVLSVALLAGAGLLVRSFQELSRVDAGFDAQHVLTFRITGSFSEPYEHVRLGVERMLDELAALPGVVAAATSSPVPGVENDGSGFQFGNIDWSLAGAELDPGRLMTAEQRVVSPEYFATMRIPVLAGGECRQAFGEEIGSAAVNRAFVTRYLDGRSPIGLELRAGNNAVRVASVVGDARDFGLAHAPVPTVYRCLTVSAYPPLVFLVRSSNDEPLALAGTIRDRFEEIEPSRSIYDVQPLTRRMGDEYAADRLRTVLIGLFAGAALALVCLGIYGTLSYVVSLRRREIGLRLALGALGHTIVGQFLCKTLKTVVVACLLGVMLALVVTRGLENMLFGVSTSDPVTHVAVVVMVLSVASIAAIVPARRAARVDPMTALREE